MSVERVTVKSLKVIPHSVIEVTWVLWGSRGATGDLITGTWGLRKLGDLELDPPIVDAGISSECSLSFASAMVEIKFNEDGSISRKREGAGVERLWGASVCGAAFYRSPTITLHKQSGTRFSWALSKYLGGHLSPELDAVQ